MRLIAALPLLLTGLIAGCATTEGGDDAHPQVQVEPAADGWRWESYGGIELQIPEVYEWNTSGSPTYPAWCAAGGPDGEPAPGVNRRWNQVIPMIACTSERPVNTYAPAVDLASHEPVGTVRLVEGWVSETVEVAGVKVTVSDDDDARRERILASIRSVGDTDAHGCAPSSDLTRPGARPGSTPPTADDVTAVAVCRYALPADFGAAAPPKPLVSSSRISGAEATDLVRAVLAAPEGEGPNSPESCAPEVALGEEALVLRIESSRGLHEVIVRYSGCDGHRTDDGTTTRALTSDALNAVLTGPNQPSTLQGDVAALLDR